jgi:nicotinate-nucleotide adenylyltransferase
MTAPGAIGLLGGTFDPVHVGHVAVAEACLGALGLERVLLVPASIPPHRPAPRVSIYHRFAMVALAAMSAESLMASDIEVEAADPSYTAVLLDRMRSLGHAPSQLVFITGADAFAEIATWHDYPAVLDRAHFAVVSRPGYDAGSLRRSLPELAARFIDVPSRPLEQPLRAPDAHPTAIFLIEAETPDVSSTLVRERAGNGGWLHDLVPGAVAEYILRHRLYADGQGRVLA